MAKEIKKAERQYDVVGLIAAFNAFAGREIERKPLDPVCEEMYDCAAKFGYSLRIRFPDWKATREETEFRRRRFNVTVTPVGRTGRFKIDDTFGIG